MLKRFVGNFVVAVFAICLLVPVMADSEPVTGEPGLKKLLADIGISYSGDNATSINNAKEFVISRQAQKKRAISFKSPAAFEEINQKYLTIYYDVEIKPDTLGVVSILFERSGDKIVFAEGKYLLWLGPDDMKEYKNITTDKVCDYYRKLGANDCFPVVTHAKLARATSLKADIKHNHSGDDINSGIIKEQFIDDSIARDSEVKALFASISNKTVAVAPVPAPQPKVTAGFNPNSEGDLKDRVAQLEAEVKRLSELLKDVSRNGDSMVFTNMNLHVVNGAGNTESANGKGNIIIGYNEGKGARSGSHNLVVGPRNSYSSYGAIVSGAGNSSSGKYASVISGTSNNAQGDYSTILGGEKNNASGAFSVIAGGAQRSATTVNPHFSAQ